MIRNGANPTVHRRGCVSPTAEGCSPTVFTVGETSEPCSECRCGDDQHFADIYSPAARLDGVLGLGRGAIGLLSQLKQHGIAKNVVGTKGVGYLFFGNGPHGSECVPLKAGLNKSLKEVADPALPLCSKRGKPFKSVFKIKDFQVIEFELC